MKKSNRHGDLELQDISGNLPHKSKIKKKKLALQAGRPTLAVDVERHTSVSQDLSVLVTNIGTPTLQSLFGKLSCILHNTY